MNKLYFIILTAALCLGLLLAASRTTLNNKKEAAKATVSVKEQNESDFTLNASTPSLTGPAAELAQKLEAVHARVLKLDARQQSLLFTKGYSDITMKDIERHYLDFWKLSPQYTAGFMEEIRRIIRTENTEPLTSQETVLLFEAKDEMLRFMETGAGDNVLKAYLAGAPQNCIELESKIWAAELLKQKREKGAEALPLGTWAVMVRQSVLPDNKKEAVIRGVTDLYAKGQMPKLFRYETDYVYNACKAVDETITNPNKKPQDTIFEVLDQMRLPILDIEARYLADAHIKYNDPAPIASIDEFNTFEFFPAMGTKYKKMLFEEVNKYLKSNKKPVPPTPEELQLREDTRNKLMAYFTSGKEAYGLMGFLSSDACIDIISKSDSWIFFDGNDLLRTDQDADAEFWKIRKPTHFNHSVLSRLKQMAQTGKRESLNAYERYAWEACYKKHKSDYAAADLAGN